MSATTILVESKKPVVSVEFEGERAKCGECASLRRDDKRRPVCGRLSAVICTDVVSHCEEDNLFTKVEGQDDTLR